MALRILFDYHGMDNFQVGGVVLYTHELIRHLPVSCQAVLGCRMSVNEEIQRYPGITKPPRWLCEGGCLPKKILKSLRWRYIRYWNKRFLRKVLSEGESFDLLHITWDLEPWCFPYLVGNPFVFTVHDLIPEISAKNDSAFVRRRRWLAEHAVRLIAVSEHTKQDCVRVWGVPEAKIDVVYHAPSVLTGEYSCRFKTPYLPYILFVGNRGGYKNFAWFAEAVAPLLHQRPSLRLICTGCPFNREERALLKHLGLESRANARFVETIELPSLYRAAAIFVHPSLYEGFGIPILDAFQAGCPVLLSRCSCFPEIGGDAALYFEAGNSESLRTQIASCLDNATLRESLVAKGRERSKQFSWEKAALETSHIYEKALSEYQKTTELHHETEQN